jgi:hypothetical protein
VTTIVCLFFVAVQPSHRFCRLSQPPRNDRAENHTRISRRSRCRCSLLPGPLRSWHGRQFEASDFFPLGCAPSTTPRPFASPVSASRRLIAAPSAARLAPRPSEKWELSTQKSNDGKGEALYTPEAPRTWTTTSLHHPSCSLRRHPGGTEHQRTLAPAPQHSRCTARPIPGGAHFLLGWPHETDRGSPHRTIATRGRTATRRERTGTCLLVGCRPRAVSRVQGGGQEPKAPRLLVAGRGGHGLVWAALHGGHSLRPALGDEFSGRVERSSAARHASGDGDLWPHGCRCNDQVPHGTRVLWYGRAAASPHQSPGTGRARCLARLPKIPFRRRLLRRLVFLHNFTPRSWKKDKRPPEPVLLLLFLLSCPEKNHPPIHLASPPPVRLQPAQTASSLVPRPILSPAHAACGPVAVLPPPISAPASFLPFPLALAY